MESNVYDLLSLLKNGKISESFAAHFEQHFNCTTSGIDLRKYNKFKVVKQLNSIDAMDFLMKQNCNPCMEEQLLILKKDT